jgi:protein-S-isoprenylcysteine O-methyltransferase Ste14
MVLGVALIGWAFLAFRSHKTTVLPHQRADALIASGPFAWSRNPIYLGEAVILTGLALYHGSLWHALAIPVFMLVLTKLAIEREEAHLAARFGDAWAAYRARVRRWL